MTGGEDARKSVEVLFALEWAATPSSISPCCLSLSVHPPSPMPPSKFEVEEKGTDTFCPRSPSLWIFISSYIPPFASLTFTLPLPFQAAGTEQHLETFSPQTHTHMVPLVQSGAISQERVHTSDTPQNSKAVSLARG